MTSTTGEGNGMGDASVGVKTSRINDLIRELCPDNVEFKALGEVVGVLLGTRHPEKRPSRRGVSSCSLRLAAYPI